jgi:long-subunit acyl-CoA synthetase (AMP-forming)
MVMLNTMLDPHPRWGSRQLRVCRDAQIRTVPLAQVARMARAVAVELAGLGIGKGDRVGISARNSLEALVLDLAVGLRRGVTAGVEAGQTRLDPKVAIQRFGLKLFFVDPPTETGGRVWPISSVTTWIADVGDAEPGPVPPEPDYGLEDIFAIKFTSGSTGPPKGLEATVGSVVASLDAVQQLFDHGPTDNILVFLPQNLLQQRYWVYSAFLYGHDISLIHVDAVTDAPRISWMARQARPTVIMGVPSFYEALRKQMAEPAGCDPAARGRAIQGQLGGCIRYLWTGSAPISRDALDFFNDANVPLYEGYGLNETCIVAKNGPGKCRIGSAGKPLAHMRVRFDPDGVIVVRSQYPVNRRYTWCGPDDNAKLFLDTGEVYTHDIGYLDADGFLFVQGRKDDILILTTGYNILPNPIEAKLTDHPAIRHAALVGHRRAFLSAVIDYDETQASWSEISAHIERMNAESLPEQRVLAVVPAHDRFSLANGCLGNQGKLVRRTIAARYESEIQAIYDGSPAPTSAPSHTDSRP